MIVALSPDNNVGVFDWWRHVSLYFYDLHRSYLKNIFWRNSKLVFGLPDFTTRFA
jgi:hypothetical protein